MVRRLLLIVCLSFAAVLVSAPADARAAVAAGNCSEIDRNLGLCSSVGGGSVELIGKESIPGQPPRGAPDPEGPGTSVSSGSAPIPPMFPADWSCWLSHQIDPSVCDVLPEAETPGTPPITLRDIATFTPTPGRQQMEPEGWTVAGLDTNFYAITGQHVVNGTLLGRPADVRFTPTSYLWAYGDGSSSTKSTKGGTWESQGIAEFEPTPTSHVYEQLGDYTITLSIVFAPEYRFAGGPWHPVVGTITLPANDLHIRVGSAKTVLVEHDCLANPAGPGC